MKQNYWQVYLSQLGIIFITSLVSINIAQAQLSIVSIKDFKDVNAIEAPIAKVSIYQGHAVVHRHSKTKLTPQGSLIKFPDLPSSASNIKVLAKGGELLRLNTQIQTRTKLDRISFTQHLENIEKLNKQALRLNTEYLAQKNHLGYLFNLMSPQSDKALNPLSLNQKTHKTWQQFYRFMDREQAQYQQKLITKEQELNSLFLQYQREWATIKKILDEAQERQVLEAFALLKSKTTKLASVELSYQVPNVSWTPSYEVHVDVNKAQAQRNFGIKVNQASGEDWNNVMLEVSSAYHPMVTKRPQLQTWLLSEQKQFIPRIQAANRPQRPALFAKPHASQTEKTTKSDLQSLNDRFIRSRQDCYQVSVSHPTLAQILNTHRVNQLVLSNQVSTMGDLFAEQTLGTVGTLSQSTYGLGLKGTGAGGGGLAKKSYRSRPRPSRRSSRSRRAQVAPPPAPMPTSAPASLADDARSYAEAELTPASSLASSHSSRAGSSRGASQGLSFADLTHYAPKEPEYVHRYTAPNLSTIPNHSQALTIPMEVVNLPIDLVYEATPALSKYVYLSGKALHKGSHAIMSGMASIFSNGAFVSESRLNTILPGEEFAIALGADLDVEVKRHLEVKTSTSGVFSKTETNVYTVQLQVANYKKRPIKIKLHDVLPVSDHDKVSVELIKSSPKAKIEDPKQGIVQWEINLKPGEKRKLVLNYEIKNPAEWRVFQK